MGVNELPHSELDQLPDGLKKVVEEVIVGMHDGSWIIQPNPIGSVWDGNQVAKAYRQSAKLREFFGYKRGKPSVYAPNTMAVGLYSDPHQRDADRFGLFSVHSSGSYSEGAVMGALDGVSPQTVSHHRVWVNEVTGRAIGNVSLLLDEDHLRRFYTIEISPYLQMDLSEPDAIVAYALPGSIMFCAKGKEFLSAYAQVLSRRGIKTNLVPEQAQLSAIPINP